MWISLSCDSSLLAIFASSFTRFHSHSILGASDAHARRLSWASLARSVDINSKNGLPNSMTRVNILGHYGVSLQVRRGSESCLCLLLGPSSYVSWIWRLALDTVTLKKLGQEATSITLDYLDSRVCRIQVLGRGRLLLCVARGLEIISWLTRVLPNQASFCSVPGHRFVRKGICRVKMDAVCCL